MVAIINEEQRLLLIGRMYDGVSYFNVNAKDIDENYIIGQEEINACIMEDLQWVKSLELIEYKPKPFIL